MDEPLAHVDRARASHYWDIVMTYIADHDISLLYATHSPALVLGYAERVVFLNQGKILYEGDVDTLYWRPPDKHLASCLGPANWFTPADSGRWLGVEAASARCYRSQQLLVEQEAPTDLTICSSRFGGNTTISRVRHEPSGDVRQFFHAPSLRQLETGQSVSIVIRSHHGR
jgi:energy-coupling factor transporter ATP-binding protein EcfA2